MLRAHPIITAVAGAASLFSASTSISAVAAPDAECAQHAHSVTRDAADTTTIPTDHTPTPTDHTQPPSHAKALPRAIRQRILDFQSAWNRADLSAVVSQYDPSLSAIWQPEFVDYDGYLKSVREMMASPTPPKITLEIHTIIPLGADYAVANGHAFTCYADGHEIKEIFTIIYKRYRGALHRDDWKLVYVHSGFY